MILSNKKILITGGATGIGLGLTERFLEENNTVIICSRNSSTLKDVLDKYPDVIIKVCDLSKEEERENLFNWISIEHSDLNILINNAGIEQDIPIYNKDFYKKAEEEIKINIEAPIHLSSLFQTLKSLEVIMNVTSAVAFVPKSDIAIYCATKAFLHSFTLSLRHLLKEKNIEVIEIIPPEINTNLGGNNKHILATPVSIFIDSIFKQLSENKNEITYGFSDDIIHYGIDDLKKIFNKMNP